MENEVDKRCGTCRRFVPVGEKGEDGVQKGFCSEFTGPCDENCLCHPDVTYRPMRNQTTERNK